MTLRVRPSGLKRQNLPPTSRDTGTTKEWSRGFPWGSMNIMIYCDTNNHVIVFPIPQWKSMKYERMKLNESLNLRKNLMDCVLATHYSPSQKQNNICVWCWVSTPSTPQPMTSELVSESDVLRNSSHSKTETRRCFTMDGTVLSWSYPNLICFKSSSRER